MGDLSEIKTGEYVCTEGRGNCINLYMVTKLTNTQVVCGDTRFLKSNGKKIGSSTWDYGRHGRKATDKDILKVKTDNAKYYIHKKALALPDDLALNIQAMILDYVENNNKRKNP